MGEELVLLHAGTGAYYGLDAVGAGIFKALTEAGDVPEAARALLDQYDVDADQLRADVESLVERLTGLGLLEWKG